MNHRKSYLKFLNFSCLCLLGALLLLSCSTENKKAGEEEDMISPQDNQVTLKANGLMFEGPDSIPFGWSQITFDNPTAMVHFSMVERLPDGKTIADQQREVAPVFQNIMDNINKKELSAPDKGFEVPEWFSNIVFLGGPGLVSPNNTSTTSVYLEPGTYLFECYIKSEGIFHSYNPSPDMYGMVHQVTVTQDSSVLEEPQEDLTITLSSTKGIQMPEAPEAGQQIIKVMFEDQKPYKNFVGHDLHLFAVTETTDLDSISKWMDWTKPDGMQTPAPAEFLGGVNEMPAGEYAYLHLDLKPGRYAWVAEIPEPGLKDFLKEFEVK